MAAQVKLLRAVQEGEVEAVGGRKPVKVDVRLISATNRDLIADVKAGRFREDLFYRLHVFPISLPPLRERPEDIPDLARHFLARFCAEEGKSIRAITGEALALLSSFRWPGNVRQLENAVFRAVVLSDGPTVGIAEFPQIAALAAAGPAPDAPRLIETAPSLVTVPEPFQPVSGYAPDSIALLDSEGQVRPLDELEREVIRFAINHYRGQMSEVARRLQIGRSTLYRKLEALEIQQSPQHSDTSAVA
jgi:DNA-binding NtrC family response regulator